MMDMSQTVDPKSDQLNADSLVSGPLTIKITRVSGNSGNAEQPVNVYFEGDNNKPYRPCKIMRRVMIQGWGADASQYVGRSMTLYRDPTVKWGGMEVGGIRISHMSHIPADFLAMLTVSQKNRAPSKIKVLHVSEPTPPQRNPEAEQSAIAAAKQGKASFTDWWNSDYGKSMRETVAPVLDECKRLAAEYEAAQTTTTDDEPPM